jgi:putative thioredoxin
MTAVDVTDATFETEVMQRSKDVPVVVDLWAPWCGPCRTLGPIIEKVIDETEGQVALVKVNVDENPQISQAFGVQSIPLVVAVKDGQPVDGFLGAHPESTVREFVERLLPSAEEQALAALVAAGDEASLRQALEVDPGNEDAVVALAELLVGQGETEEALALLARCPRRAGAPRGGAGRVGDEPTDEYDAKLTALLTGCATTTRPARSTSTSWSCSARTTRGRRGTGASSPAGCTEPPDRSRASDRGRAQAGRCRVRAEDLSRCASNGGRARWWSWAVRCRRAPTPSPSAP